MDTPSTTYLRAEISPADHDKINVCSTLAFGKISYYSVFDNLRLRIGMIVAELSVEPIGEGTSISRFVKEALEALRRSGVKHVPNAMGTVIEANSLDELFAATKAAHEAVFRAGARRVVTTLRLDDRRDKAITIQSKLDAVASR